MSGSIDRSCTTFAALVITLTLTACPRGSPSRQGASPAPIFKTEADILQIDAAQPSVQEALATCAEDKSERATMRYTALRRLEECAPDRSVSVAEKLALDPARTKDAGFLRENATALLCRSKTSGGKQALDRVKAGSLEAAVLAARLSRKEGR